MSCLVGGAYKSARIPLLSRLVFPLCEESADSDGSGWKSAGVSERESEMEDEVVDGAGFSIVRAVRPEQHGVATMEPGRHGGVEILMNIPLGVARSGCAGRGSGPVPFRRYIRCWMSALCGGRQGRPGAPRKHVLSPSCPGHAPRVVIFYGFY